MFAIKDRSAGSLLKKAKKLIAGSQKKSQNIGLTHQNTDLKINENKRNRDVPGYVKLPPHEFMSWWIASTGAKRHASNILLHYMKYHFGAEIPVDYRTLLKTPVKPVPLPIHPGEYMHVGVQRALHHLLCEVPDVKSTFSTSIILMQFFVDGLRIRKSTRADAWIIMMNIRHSLKKRLRLVPKVIGVYYGEKKLRDFNDFLWPFVMELLDLLDVGIQYGNMQLKLKILNFVLDAPARCYCKQVKGVNGYFGCDVCVEEGDHIDHRMTFLNMNDPERNNVDYRTRAYDDQDYHKKESVLELLPIDMIEAFPHDYLHCLLLGVEKWILEYTCKAPKSLSTRDHEVIKQRVTTFKSTQPREFQRKLRSFVEDIVWMKGTEFRTYALFVGPLLLKGLISEEKIANLLKLQIASIIFTHERFSQYYTEADKLMRMFVEEFKEIYHPRHVTYVFHSLCHMKKFVDIYGSWDNFSTFEYESNNSRVKDMLHGNFMPLTQITNRIIEIYQSPKHDFGKSSHRAEVKDRKDDGSFVQLTYHGLHFHREVEGQNYVLLKSGRSVELVSIFQDKATSEIVLIGKPFKNCSSVFVDLVDTIRFNIFKCKLEFDHSIEFDIKDIDGKLWRLDIPDSLESAFYPIYIEDGKSFM